ncbi:phosphoribosylglycinamide formyltransferase [Bacteroidia bacterium]|nr:phosphoribosylglycinamide formyltransferase [Bacteroidia bacterium]GHT81002.1 phosphoribosylglycinamide formyltransferase [Bacteroidia bacterium]
MTNIAIFASGNGTNFEAIAAACQSGKIAASVVLLVCDKPTAYVVERAKKYNVPAFVFNPKTYAHKADYETEICNLLQANHVDLVCLAGYMRIVGDVLLSKYEGRMLNIHPSLLPAFKGAHAIDDAFNFGVKVFGVTVHLIDNTLDGGTIVAQRAFEYHGNDRNEVEAKIHSIEYELYVEAIQQLSSTKYHN